MGRVDGGKRGVSVYRVGMGLAHAVLLLRYEV